MAHKDDYIIHKSIKKDEKKGVVTLSVTFRVAEHPRGKNIRKYDNTDALRWLSDGGVKVGEVLQGCKTSNYVGGQPPGTKPEGVWVFKLQQEPTKRRKAPKKQPVKKTLQKQKRETEKNSIAEAASIIASEFDGLNYDGDSIEQPEVKKTSRRKRKSKETTNEE